MHQEKPQTIPLQTLKLPMQAEIVCPCTVILNENNPSTFSNSRSTSINEDHCYSALCHPKRKKLTLQIYQQRLLPSCQQNMHINALNLKISHCCYLLVCYLCCINNKDKRIILHCFLSCLQSSLEWLRISFPQFLQRGAFLLDLYGLLIWTVMVSIISKKH